MRRIAVIFICSYFLSCGSSNGLQETIEAPAVKQAAVQSECPNGTTLSYENFGEAFMVTYCVQCHSSEITGDERLGAPTNINFNSYDDITVHRRDIIKSAARKKNPKMPPSQHVPLEERELLSEWLKCGAPGERSQINP